MAYGGYIPGGLPASAPAQPSLWDMLGSGLSRNSNGLIGLGEGLLTAPTFSQGLAQGAQGFQQGHTQDVQTVQAKDNKNATVGYLQKKYPDLANWVQQGGSISDAWTEAMRRDAEARKPVTQSTDIQNYEYSQSHPGYSDYLNRKDRSITPSGYQWTPDQKLEPIPGGPADPTSAQSLSPDALDMIATQYLAGDKSAITGYARNASMRAQIANAVAAKANANGMDGKSIAAEISAYGGNVAAQRAAGTRAAQVGMAASEANQMADVAMQASQKVPRGSFVPWNAAMNAVATGTSSPEMAAFVTATTSLVNAYARAVSPLGAPTDAMRQHAEQMLNTAQGPEAYAAVIAQMKKEMEAALNAPAEISSSLKSNITGASPSTGGATAPTGGVVDYRTYFGGQ